MCAQRCLLKIPLPIQNFWSRIYSESLPNYPASLVPLPRPRCFPLPTAEQIPSLARDAQQRRVKQDRNPEPTQTKHVCSIPAWASAALKVSQMGSKFLPSMSILIYLLSILRLNGEFNLINLIYFFKIFFFLHYFLVLEDFAMRAVAWPAGWGCVAPLPAGTGDMWDPRGS